MSSVLKFALILLAAGVLALFARSWFISHQDQPAPPPETVRIRTAAATLPTGLLLRENDLGWKSVLTDNVPKDALREGSPEANLSGALLRGPKKTNEVILASDVIRSDAPGFLAASLKPGMRAVSVPIDEVSGNAGLIQPGDFVDIILTQRLREGNELRRSAPQVVSETVVERVRVIAVGSSFQRKTEDDTPNRARTVTFEVAPRAAKAVTVAAQLGTLSMALRSFAVDKRGQPDNESGSVVAWGNGSDNESEEEQRPVWGNDISRALNDENSNIPQAIPQAAMGRENAQPPRRVIILRGSQRQEQELDSNAR